MDLVKGHHTKKPITFVLSLPILTLLLLLPLLNYCPSPLPPQIQKQVHPRLDIEDDAVIYLEALIFRLLAQMCATQPRTLDDVEAYVQRNFASPIDAWALSDAKVMMDRAQRRKAVFTFPVEKIYSQLQKVRTYMEARFTVNHEIFMLELFRGINFSAELFS